MDKDEADLLKVFIVCCALFFSILVICMTVQTNSQDSVKIEAQQQVEKTRIEQDAKLKRTQEIMNAVPWHKRESE